MTNNMAYGEHGHRDGDKVLEAVKIKQRLGRIHFIRFPTSQMRAFIDLSKVLSYFFTANRSYYIVLTFHSQKKS